MFSIGEFSKISGLPVKTLRFYHEKGLLVPAAVDPGSGYRYYDDTNAEKARVIVALRDLGFSLEDIGEMLTSYEDDADIVEFLRRRKAAITGQLRQGRKTLAKLDAIIHSETAARAAARQSPREVEEKDIESLLVAGVRMQGNYSDCGQGFATLGRRVGRHICGKPLCLYYDAEYREDDADLETCYPVRRQVEIDGVRVRQLPAGRFVCLLHAGPYQQLGRTYGRVLRHAKQRGYELALPSREVYLKGPGMIFRGNPNKYLTEIQLQIQPAASGSSDTQP